MQSLPSAVEIYKRSPDFTFTSTPEAFRSEHKTKQGTWGRIIVAAGNVAFHIPADKAVHRLTPDVPGIIEPEVMHFVDPSEDAVFFVEFLRAPKLIE